MRLTTKGRYAVTAILDLAMQHGQATPLSEIAKRQNLSISYLEQLFAKLKHNGLVMSVRGAAGGYLLAKSPDDIMVLDIINAVNESIDATQCDGQANCHHGSQCLTHDLWTNLSTHIESYLANIAIAELIHKNNPTTALSSLKTETPTFFSTGLSS